MPVSLQLCVFYLIIFFPPEQIYFTHSMKDGNPAVPSHFWEEAE